MFLKASHTAGRTHVFLLTSSRAFALLLFPFIFNHAVDIFAPVDIIFACPDSILLATVQRMTRFFFRGLSKPRLT